MTSALEYIQLTAIFVFFWLIIIWGMFFLYQYILKTIFIKLFNRKKVKAARAILEAMQTEEEKVKKLKDYSNAIINEASKGAKVIKTGGQNGNIQQETRTEPTTEPGGNPAEDKPRDSSTPRHRDIPHKEIRTTRTFSNSNRKAK